MPFSFPYDPRRLLHKSLMGVQRAGELGRVWREDPDQILIVIQVLLTPMLRAALNRPWSDVPRVLPRVRQLQAALRDAARGPTVRISAIRSRAVRGKGRAHHQLFTRTAALFFFRL